MTESGTVHLATPVWVSAGPDCAHDSSGTQGVCSKRSPGGLVSKDPTSALSHLANQVPRFGGRATNFTSQWGEQQRLCHHSESTPGRAALGRAALCTGLGSSRENDDSSELYFWKGARG